MQQYNGRLSRLFWRGRAVTVTTTQGEAITGRGFLFAASQGEREYGDARHPLGAMSRPLMHFVGVFRTALPLTGGTLTADEDEYLVLREQSMTWGGKPLCVRLLLERSELDEFNRAAAEPAHAV